MVDDHDIQRFEDLLQEFDHAMLVSVARDGTLHARPMAIAESDGAFLAISGTASVINDAERIGRLWQSAWRPWFPEGPDDPNLVLLEIDPERAEYWDRRRARRLEYLWRAGKALATGRRVAEESLSGHGKFSFG